MDKLMKYLFVLTLLTMSSISYSMEIKDLRQDSEFPDYEAMMFTNFTDNQKVTGRNHTLTLLIKNDEVKEYFATIMKLSSQNKQTLLIQSNELCSENASLNNQILQVNNQNIKALGVCNIDGFKYYIPETSVDKNYVIKQFKVSKWVTIKFPNIQTPIPFDSTGFTTAWDNLGGDTL